MGRSGRGRGAGHGVGGWSDLVANETELRVNRLAGLFELARDLGGAPTFEDAAANDFLLLGERDGGVGQSGAAGIFEISKAAAAIDFEIVWGEEPAIYYPQAANATTFDQVHEVPVRHLQRACRLVTGEQAAEGLKSRGKLLTA